jgi:hypothetical protein
MHGCRRVRPQRLIATTLTVVALCCVIIIVIIVARYEDYHPEFHYRGDNCYAALLAKCVRFIRQHGDDDDDDGRRP